MGYTLVTPVLHCTMGLRVSGGSLHAGGMPSHQTGKPSVLWQLRVYEHAKDMVSDKASD